MTEHLNDEQLNVLVDRLRFHLGVEGDGDPLREHLESCSECGDRFGRLVKMLSVAESMPQRVEPPEDLWPSIRATIEQGRVPEGGTDRDTRADTPFSPRRYVRISFAAAAGVLLALTLGTYVLSRRTDGAPGQGVTSAASPTGPSTGSVAPVSANTTLDSADIRAEEELMAALELRRRTLRPSTSSQIDSSLHVIDMAIAELEAARARDPNNPAIRQLLASSRARKLELLKQAQNAS